MPIYYISRFYVHMRFILDDTMITCLPDSSDEETGISDLGQPIILSTHTLHFDIKPTKLPSPDHLALICFIVFYPYLAKSSRIEWCQPVSPRVLEILKLHNLTTNINLISQQKSSQKSPQKSPQNISQISPPHSVSPKIALAWGGGLDTWATYKLHPKLYTILVHECEPTDPPINGPISPTNSSNSKFIKVTTNQKSISKKNTTKINTTKINNKLNINTINNNGSTESTGWTVWVGVMVTSIWLSAEYGINMIATGGNLGSVFLNNGVRYHPTHMKPSIWYKTFELLGLPIYLPLAGLTDIAIIKIIGSDLMEDIRYCWFPTPTGDNCHKCPKCIRKETLLGRDLSEIDNFKGPSYEYIRTKDENLGKWVYHYYRPALKLIPSTFDQNILISALKENGINLLERSDEYLVEQYGYSL